MVTRQFLAGLDQSIELRDRQPELAIEFPQLSGHIGSPDTGQITDFHVVVFEPGLAPKSPHELQIRWDEPLHDFELPAASNFDCQRLPA